MPDIARCEVGESLLVEFTDDRVRCPDVTPCDLFWVILRDFGGSADFGANVLEVSGMGRDFFW